MAPVSWEQRVMHSPALIELLQQHTSPLQQLAHAIAATAHTGAAAGVQDTSAARADSLEQQQQQQQGPTALDEGVGAVPGVTAECSITVRQVVVYLEQAGVLARWQLGADRAAAALLHNVLAPCDPADTRWALTHRAARG